MSRSKAEPRCSPEPLREASTPMKAASVYGCRAWGLRFCETALGNLRDTSTVTPAEITSVRQPSAVRHGLSPPPTPMPYTSEQSGARQTRPLSRKCNAQTLSLSLCFLHIGFPEEDMLVANGTSPTMQESDEHPGEIPALVVSQL